MEEKPSYYAIIPANVRYDEELKANAKLLYGEITCLSNKTGICYASNNYFAKLYKVKPSAISNWVSQLKNKGYIFVDYLKDGEQIKARAIRLTGINEYEYLFTKKGEGYSQKEEENNTSNNIKERKKKEIFDCDWLDDENL
jgi:hypothetical protein